MEDTKVDCAVDRAESRAEVQLPFILRSFRTRPSPHRIIPAGGADLFLSHWRVAQQWMAVYSSLYRSRQSAAYV